MVPRTPSCHTLALHPNCLGRKYGSIAVLTEEPAASLGALDDVKAEIGLHHLADLARL